MIYYSRKKNEDVLDVKTLLLLHVMKEKLYLKKYCSKIN